MERLNKKIDGIGSRLTVIEGRIGIDNSSNSTISNSIDNTANSNSVL